MNCGNKLNVFCDYSAFAILVDFAVFEITLIQRLYF